MSARKQTGEFVEAALNSLDGLQRQQANPYLFTRIEQRIINRKQAASYSNTMFRLAIVLLVFIAVNVLTYHSLHNSNTGSNNKTAIEAFAQDYELQQSGENI